MWERKPWWVLVLALLAASCADEPPAAPVTAGSDPGEVADDTTYHSPGDEALQKLWGFWPGTDMHSLGEGPRLSDGDGCHDEPTQRWDCSPGEGKISFSACPSGGAILSANLFDAFGDHLGACLERAAWYAGDSADVTRAHISSGGGIVNDRTIRGGELRSNHSWGRAVDISDVKLTFGDGTSKTYRYSLFAGDKTDTADYRFFDRLRGCWGNATWGLLPTQAHELLRGDTLGSESCDDDPSGNHCDHMHLSLSSYYLYATCGGVLE